jgi:pilus assembly protein CpaE
MPEPQGKPDARALVISPDPRLASDLAALLERELPSSPAAVLRAYPAQAELQAAAAAAWLCFLDITANPPGAFAVLSAISGACPNVAVVALLGANEPDLILQCLRQGASEFLIQPFTADQLRAVLDKLKRFRPAGPEAAAAGGRVYCVMPAKGACGATTVAVNIAFALKRLLNKPVFLADMDGLTGTLPFLLKLKSNYSFVDALSQAGSLDADLWRALVTRCQGIDVLLSPENPVQSIGEAYDPSPLIRYARQSYEAAVLDIAGALGDCNLAAIRSCDELLVVTTNELPALHAAQRLLLYLELNDIDRAKVRLLVNRFREQIGLCRDDIATALRQEVFHTAPNDHPAIARSLMEGKPAQAATDFGKSISALAKLLGSSKASTFTLFSG